MVSPPSMRATSSTRSPPSRGRTSVIVRPRSTRLRTTRWRSAMEAIWGRWVTQSTWWRSAIARSLRPTTSATRPPMPVSTSSKTSVLPTSGSSRVATDFKARRMRDSSPPEAIRARGRSSSPGFGESRNSAVSSPRSVQTALSSSPATSGWNCTRKRVFSIASWPSSDCTFFSSSRAAARRLRERMPEAARHRVLVVVEEAEGLARQVGPPAGACLQPLLLAQRLLFPGRQVRPLDLGGLIVEHLAAALGLAPVAAQGLQLGLDLAQPPERRSEGFGFAGQARVTVEHGDVAVRIEQALRLVLPVDRGERRRQVPQHADGHQRAVDGGLALAGGVHLAAQDDVVALHGKAMGLGRPGSLRALEDRLDDRSILPRADQLR